MSTKEADSHEAVKTTDHEVIRKWVEARKGRPATVKSTERGHHAGILRIEFPEYAGSNDDKLEEIDWDEFFAKFEQEKLAFLHQDKTKSGEISRFFKFVQR